jgi:DNA-binding FrmR family transcriptional regulator
VDLKDVISLFNALGMGAIVVIFIWKAPLIFAAFRTAREADEKRIAGEREADRKRLDVVTDFYQKQFMKTDALARELIAEAKVGYTHLAETMRDAFLQEGRDQRADSNARFVAQQASHDKQMEAEKRDCRELMQQLATSASARDTNHMTLMASLLNATTELGDSINKMHDGVRFLKETVDNRIDQTRRANAKHGHKAQPEG